LGEQSLFSLMDKHKIEDISDDSDSQQEGQLSKKIKRSHTHGTTI